MSEAGTLKRIKRHLEDHPGYYHEETEIKFLLEQLDKEQEAHRKTAKHFVDADAYAKHLEVKIKDIGRDDLLSPMPPETRE